MALRNNRSLRTEGALSFGVLFLVGVALFLVYIGKREDVPPHPLVINDIPAETFAQTLGVDADLAARIITYRTALGGFSSCDQLLLIPLFPKKQAEQFTGLIASAKLDPAKANATHFVSILGISPALARRLVAYRDTLLTSVAADVPAKGISVAPAALSPKWILHASLLDPHETRPLLKRFVIRLPFTVFWQYWGLAFLLLLVCFLLPPLLRSHVAGDPFLLPLTLLLSGLGVVLLFSIKDPLRDQASYLHHGSGIALALIAFILTARLAPHARRRIKNYQYLWVIASAGLVVLLDLFGHGPDDVRLNLFGFFQPVEVIKLLLVFFLASYLSDRADLIADTTPRTPEQAADARRRWPDRGTPRLQDLGPMVVMFLIALTMFYVVKDLGPGVLMFVTFIGMLYLTTGRGSFVWIGLLLLISGGALGYALHVGVFPTRVDMWQHPFQNSHPTGMQLGQSYWAMASGGIEGSGLGLGMPGLIPRGGSDLAFASWAEETGLLGVWTILIIYVALVWRGIRVALRAGNDFDRALAFGLTALLGLQTLFIVGGVTGVFPLSGIAIPFLSYGNSALVANFVLIGLLRGISVPPSGGVGRQEARLEVARAARYFGIAFTVALFGGIGIWRMGQLQGVQANAIAARPIVTPDADKVARPHMNPRLLAMAAAIERGSIYDRNGRVLATSRPAEIAQIVRDGKQAERLAALHKRVYPFGSACVHLVGYLDPATGGPFGFEKGYDDALRGFHRYTDLLTDYRNRNMPGYQPRRGQDLHLTIDAALQRDVQTMLWKTASELKDLHTGRPKDRAAFVVLNPATGDVIVAATIPTFDPNTLTPDKYHEYRAGPDAVAEHRLINRAVSGLYPPGSTLKVATTACALDHLADTMQFSVPCNEVSPDIRWQARGVTYVRRNIHDDKGDPRFGDLTLAPAFRVSSNIYFANLAAQIGAKTFRTTLADQMKFHYTPKQDFFDADLPDIGYGQGRMLASPLEMARLAGSVVNAGVMMEPRFVSSTLDPLTKKKTVVPNRILSQAMSPQTASTLQGLMRTVVVGGTASGVFTELPFAVAGKTGTAQNHQFDHEPHSWFVGYAPYAEPGKASASPPLAFACVVENGGYGKHVAAIICRNVLRKLF